MYLLLTGACPACPTEDTWAVGETGIYLHLHLAISEGAASPGKRAGDLLVDALVDYSGRRKLSSSVLLDLITKLSHVGNTGLSRLNQDWAGPYFLGQRVFRWAHWKAEIARQVGGLYTQS